jgi:hypothetical protein
MGRDSRVQDRLGSESGPSLTGGRRQRRIASEFDRFAAALPPRGSAAAAQTSAGLPARCAGAADPGSREREA